MMDTNKILQADLLEILFDGRNKAYGAYELRVNYKKRLYMAVVSMLMFCALMLLLYFIASGRENKYIDVPVISDVDLKKVEEPKQEPPPVEKPKPIEKPVAMKAYTPPLITNEVKEDERPPEMNEMEDTKIGTINVDGDKYDNVVAPPIDAGDNGVIDAPKKKEDDFDKTWVDVQIQAEYPGGIEKWRRYLIKNMRYPQEAVDSEIQGTVLVQFIVDKDGAVSDVVAVSGPELLRGEAVRVIRASGKWIPAEHNGRKVKAYRKQPVVFQLAVE